MDTSSTQLRAGYTRRLAELLSGEDGARTLAMMQKLRSAVIAGEEPFRLPRIARDRVGIWRRAGDEYRRDPARRAQWRLWCDRDVIGAPAGSPQIALLGESAARGYFYDPMLNCASVLEDALRTVSTLTECNVVDLAHTNATATDVLRTALESATLGPQCLVLFAGNNWHNIDLSPHHLQRVANAIDDEGFAGGQRVFLDLVTRHSAAVLDAMAALRDVLQIPLVLVVPEFNLVDWSDEVAQLPPVLADSGDDSWRELRQAAEKALAVGDFTEAVRCGDGLVKLDRGTSPVGHRIRAEAMRRQAALGFDARTVRAAFCQARDALGGLFVPLAPRCFGVVADVMRAKAGEHHFGLVDLPAWFSRDGGLPSRELFLDYCHLSRTGIELAMTAVAAEVVTALAPPTTPPPTIAPRAPSEADALAHFLAAIHNAHYGQSLDVIRYHLNTAAQADASALDQMAAYLDYQTRRAPHWMCASFMKACESPAIAKYLHADDARLTGKLADYGLRNAMVDTLVRHGRDVRSGWERLLVSEHAAAKVDLLSDACRAATFLQRRGFELGPEKRYVDCYHEISAFALVTSEGAPLRLTLTCRLPYAASGNESLTLRVNGERIAEYPLNRRWSTEFVYVPAYYVRPGLNRVELCWPPRSIDGSVQIAAAVAALERGQMPATVAVTGQIEQFVAERFDGHDGNGDT